MKQTSILITILSICVLLSNSIYAQTDKINTIEENNYEFRVTDYKAFDSRANTPHKSVIKPEQKSTATSLPQRVLAVNPLGLLQFGPIVQGEFKISEQGYLTSHLRIPYLGLLYHVINFDHSSDKVKVSPVALGFGGGYKHFFPTTKGGWYLAGILDYSFGSSKGNDGREWKSEFSNIAIMSNGGFRWQWPEKKTFMSVGAYVGVYAALHDEWWYTSNATNRFDERSASPLAMLELSFGWGR